MSINIYKDRNSGVRCLSDGERLVWLDAAELRDVCISLLIPGYGDPDLVLTDGGPEPDAEAVSRQLEDCFAMDPADELRRLIEQSRVAVGRLGVPHQGRAARWLSDDDDGHDYARVVHVSDVEDVIRDAHGRGLVLDALVEAL